MNQIADLSNEAAVKALSIVAKRWIRQRGLEAFIVVNGARCAKPRSFSTAPSWASGEPVASAESGEFSRKMLVHLKAGSDDEVSVWTDDALREVSHSQAYVVDPVTLAIGGIILIGAILAARVKKIGSIEFYKGIPKELSDVMKAGSGVVAPSDK